MKQKELEKIRHYLHQHPELSKEENNTQQYLLGLLDKLDTDKVQKVANTGILVHFKGKAKGKNILYRGDMDALPIDEEINPKYKSKTEGVSHKCGHDGHSTIMYGLCHRFSEHRPEQGNAYVLFQPAEEIGWGAKNVSDSKHLDKLKVDYVFALHNVPGFKLHNIVCRKGSFTPAVTTYIISFKGNTAHAAEPWNGENPAKAMSELMLAALKLNKENKKKHEFITVTPAHMVLGEKAYGTSAGKGSVHLTIRAHSNEVLDDVLNKVKSKAEELAKKEKLKVSFEEQEPFESNQNDATAVDVIQQSAKALGLEYIDKEAPFRWGEDFGLFTNRFKGAMFGLGSGEDCKPLHHPKYNFPDRIIKTGIDMFATIQKTAQEK